MSILRIILWSGPRNVSTAIMYSFAQRSDTRVVDEPLYGHYLRVSGAVHPGGDEVMASMNCNGAQVVRDVILGECEKPVLLVKQMAHHLVDTDYGFFGETRNALLIRDPVQMLPSLIHQIPEPVLWDTGLKMQGDLFDEFNALGQSPIVLDSREILLSPEGVLREFCSQLGIAFEESMMSWEPGARPEDGAWAPYWYHNVHKSTGFQPFAPKTEPFPDSLKPLLEECQPYYERLFAHAIKAPSIPEPAV